MEYLPTIFDHDDAYCEVTNVFSFSKDSVFLLINARSEEEELYGSALVKVKLSTTPTYELLHEFNSSTLDYFAEHPDLHYILASGGYIHKVEQSELTVYPFAANAFLSGLAKIDKNTVAVFGERGLIFRFQDGTYTQMPTNTEETLHSIHFPRPNHGYAGGNYGAFLEHKDTKFSSVELGNNEFIKAVHVKDDGSVLIGCDEGIGLVLQGDELIRVEGNDADLYSIAEYKGVEYWGDDSFGIYTRSGDQFVPKFETGYAFDINATDTLMTINAGYWVYIFDGSSWIQLQINADRERMIERIPLDFEPL